MPTTFNPEKSEQTYVEALFDQAGHINTERLIAELRNRNNSDIATIIHIQHKKNFSPENYEFVIAIEDLRTMVENPEQITEDNKEVKLKKCLAALNVLRDEYVKENAIKQVNLADLVRNDLFEKLNNYINTLPGCSLKQLQDVFKGIEKDTVINAAETEIEILMRTDTCPRILKERTESDLTDKLFNDSKETFEQQKLQSLENSIKVINKNKNIEILRLLTDRVTQMVKKGHDKIVDKKPNTEEAYKQTSNLSVKDRTKQAKIFALKLICEECKTQLDAEGGDLINIEAAIQTIQDRLKENNSDLIFFNLGIKEKGEHIGISHFEKIKEKIKKIIKERDHEIKQLSESAKRKPR